MAKCSRCNAEAPADEGACPACNAPLAPAQPLDAPAPPAGEAAPQAPAQPHGGPIPLASRPSAGRTPAAGDVLAPPPGPGRRVTLTGEVIDDGAATHLPGGVPGAPGVPNLQPGAAPSSYSPTRPGGFSIPARRESAPGRSRATGIIVAILLVLVLAGGGVFGWTYWQKRQPVIATERALAAIQAKDWQTVYSLVEFPEPMRAQLTEQRFLQAMAVIGGHFDLGEYTVAEATIDGDSATVRASVTITAMGNTRTDDSEVRLRKVDGQWKVSVDSIGLPRLPAGGLPGGFPSLR